MCVHVASLCSQWTLMMPCAGMRALCPRPRRSRARPTGRRCMGLRPLRPRHVPFSLEWGMTSSHDMKCPTVVCLSESGSHYTPKTAYCSFRNINRILLLFEMCCRLNNKVTCINIKQSKHALNAHIWIGAE